MRRTSRQASRIGHAVDHASFVRLRHQRTAVRDDLRFLYDAQERTTVTETRVHPEAVASGDRALGAILAIGTRVPRCRMDYVRSNDRNSRDGTLRLVDHDSRSWARLYYDHEHGAPYTVHQHGPRDLWDEVESAHDWWVAHGRPAADRWRFTVTPEGQHIEFLST